MRGVFTSNLAFTVATLPKDMQYKLPADCDWYSKYAWRQYPTQDNDETISMDGISEKAEYKVAKTEKKKLPRLRKPLYTKNTSKSVVQQE